MEELVVEQLLAVEEEAEAALRVRVASVLMAPRRPVQQEEQGETVLMAMAEEAEITGSQRVQMQLSPESLREEEEVQGVITVETLPQVRKAG
jgi:hypothetical protein